MIFPSVLNSKAPIYTKAQYQALQVITGLLTEHYPQIAINITGRSVITPERKIDPGPAFDWSRFRGVVKYHASMQE